MKLHPEDEMNHGLLGAHVVRPLKTERFKGWEFCILCGGPFSPKDYLHPELGTERHSWTYEVCPGTLHLDRSLNHPYPQPKTLSGLAAQWLGFKSTDHVREYKDRNLLAHRRLYRAFLRARRNYRKEQQ